MTTHSYTDKQGKTWPLRDLQESVLPGFIEAVREPDGHRVLLAALGDHNIRRVDNTVQNPS